MEFGDEDEGTLALVPRVLDSVNHYAVTTMQQDVHDVSKHPGNFVPPLSIMYEILRGWKMPELYENCGGV